MADLATNVSLLQIFDGLVALDLRRSRVFRDKNNPFDCSDELFIQTFRLSKVAAFYLIETLREYIDCKSWVNSALSAEMKVLCALNFFACGSYQRAIGDNVHILMSQSSVSKTINEIIRLISDKLMNQWVQFCLDRQSKGFIKAGFQEKFNFPGIIGAIDCTHIAIVSQIDYVHSPASVYVNRKGFHSINVQLICDSNMKILNVNAKFPGSAHDSKESCALPSSIRRAMVQHYEEGSWLLGDAGYPLEPWLLTPVQNPGSRAENMYNERHASARNVIERCNGLLKSRFRCLYHGRQLHYSPEKAGLIMNCCAVLHNICLHYNVQDPEIEPDNEAWGPIFTQSTTDQQLRRIGERIRRNLIATRFN